LQVAKISINVFCFLFLKPRGWTDAVYKFPSCSKLIVFEVIIQ